MRIKIQITALTGMFLGAHFSRANLSIAYPFNAGKKGGHR